MLQACKECLCTANQDFCVLDLCGGEATTEKIYRSAGQINALLDVVDEIDLSLGIRLVHVRELDS